VCAPENWLEQIREKAQPQASFATVMKLVNEFRYPPYPTRMRGRQEKFNATYLRANQQLKKIEYMGYGAEQGSMNSSYFDLLGESEKGVFK